MRPLIGFWGVVVGLLVAGAVVLQAMGPPVRPASVAETPVSPAPEPVVAAEAAPLPSVPVAAPSTVAAVAAVPVPWDGRIAAPDPALLEPSKLSPQFRLPRIGPDGRAPMQVYGRPFDTSDPRPRISLLIAGLGLSEAESRDAIENLPGAVSLAVSAYAHTLEPLLTAARDKGHELLVSIPMEPSGYPLNDTGTLSLLTGADRETNKRNLEAVLAHASGYVGATGASDGMRGERFAQLTTLFREVADELSTRGLLYIDPRPAAPGATALDVPGLTMRAADVVLDEPGSRADVEAKLAQLERIARDRGSALGIASSLRPVTLDRLKAWARTVEMRGFVLAPVTALVAVTPPAPAPQAGRRR